MVPSVLKATGGLDWLWRYVLCCIGICGIRVVWAGVVQHVLGSCCPGMAGMGAWLLNGQ